MKLEQLQKRPLTPDEQCFRAAYERGPTSLWERPMSFSAYEQYLEQGLVVQTGNSHLYRDKSRGHLGNTVEEILEPNRTTVSLHSRYSYPVLHNHNYIEVIYVAAGSCLNLFETSTLPMQEGDVCILSPNSFHAISCTSDESCIINMMMNRSYFDLQFLQVLRGGRLLGDYLAGILFRRDVSPYILFPTGDDLLLHAMGRMLVTEHVQQNYGYEFAIPLLIGQFLLQLVREYESTAVVPGKSGNTRNELIVGVLSYLNVNFRQATLVQTAAYFGYAPAYLSRMIKENTGKTFLQLISRIQMERAMELMERGERNITAIAQEVGCFDSSHFNKKFKAAYGISPGAYLERRALERD